jgi:hypothetical protein
MNGGIYLIHDDGRLVEMNEEDDEDRTIRLSGIFSPDVYLLDVLQDPRDWLSPRPKVPEGTKVVVSLQPSPGNVISTGTPGAVEIKDGDVVSCRMDGFEPLSNPVVRR